MIRADDLILPKKGLENGRGGLDEAAMVMARAKPGYTTGRAVWEFSFPVSC
jgi:hypothetical protein